MILSILICTIPERIKDFSILLSELQGQCANYKYANKLNYEAVEIVTDSTPKNYMSVGAKRQTLLEAATGDYIVYFDDDDWPAQNYISEILKALDQKPDCVGFKIRMTTNGAKEETCIHSLSNDKWENKGGVYLRNCTHFNPVKREIALQVGFKDVRWNEDEPYSYGVSALCKHEVFIDKYLFHYRYSNKEDSKTKYGL